MYFLPINALCLIEYRAPSSQNYYHAHSTMYESEYPKVKKIKASVGGELIERLRRFLLSDDGCPWMIESTKNSIITLSFQFFE